MSEINVTTVTSTNVNSTNVAATGNISAAGIKHNSANTAAITPNADGSVTLSGNLTSNTGTLKGNIIQASELQDLNGDPLGTGEVLQVVQRVSNSFGEFGNTAYGNNLDNLTRIDDWYVELTTTEANSRVLVQWKSRMFGPNQQHQYVDLRRRIGGSGSWTSMTATYRTNSTIDQFAGIHRGSGGNGSFEGDYFSSFMDYNLNQSAGTTVRYAQYLGGWAGGTIDYGGWDANNNQNSRGMIVMTAWELAPTS